MNNLSAIASYVYRLHSEAHENFPRNFHRIVEFNRTDLNDMKIKMEILLSQTDIKEESKNLY